MHRLIIFLLPLIFFACKTDYPGQEVSTADAGAPVPVELVSIAPETTPLTIEAGGTIGAKEQARLSFKIGGIIDRLYTREGQFVRRGAVLASLKTTEIDAQVSQARRAVEKLQRDLDRTKILLAEQAATQEMVDNLTTALEVAQSDLEIAGFNQQYARIKAPVSGRIVKKFAERGELIGPGNPVFLLTGEGKSSYVLRVGVADRDVLHLAPGDRAEVRLDAYDGATVPASVTEIAAAADPRTGSFEVELTLEPGNRTLRNGFVGRATIFPSQTPPHFRIPLDALVEGSGRQVTVFYPTADGTASAKKVRFTRLLDDAFVVMPKDLSGIDRIVTKGASYLTDGQKIESVTPKTN